MSGTTTNTDAQAPGFRIDKSISIALIVGILAQSASGAWYASEAFSRIADTERRVAALEAKFEARSTLRDQQQQTIYSALSDIKERLARIEPAVNESRHR